MKISTATKKIELHKHLRNNQSGRVTFFSIIILIMFIISAYELNIIRRDWKKVNSISLKISVLDDLRSPISGVSIEIDKKYVGQTDARGDLTALLSKPGKIQIAAKKEPLNAIDTTIVLKDDESRIAFSMTRPYSTLMITALDKSGKPLQSAEVYLGRSSFGETDANGMLTVPDTLHLFDSVYVKIIKKGFNDVLKSLYLAAATQADSFTLTEKTAPSASAPAPSTPAPAAQPDFQSHYDLANRYLDRAIGGESKYFGRALSEIDKAISARPKYPAAKQLKVEILFNFAKSLQNAGLLLEAANRCNEALKIYREIPEDPLMGEVQKLKAEIDEKLK
jgi:tetratricopeptide (TPR) repeat protein